METASYHTKGFITGSSIKWIIIISQAVLFIMIPLILFGLHPLIVTGVLIGAMALGFGLVSGKVIYTIDDSGIIKEVEPIMFKHFWKNHTFQFYPWDHIESFREGMDMNRSYEEFQYLTIFTKGGKKLEINTKSGEKNSFQNFSRVFRLYVIAAEEGKITDTSRPVSAKLEKEMMEEGVDMTGINSVKKHTIKEKPGFYQTTFAKVLTLFFMVVSAGIIAALVVMDNNRFSNIFRFVFIIVPGTAYMYYRVFVKGK
ncbi:MAG: hypothetical protein GY751_25100 [Bacteroidetes bacterium]|nr:hypothetical protein [Bacteroidota bacterium]